MNNSSDASYLIDRFYCYDYIRYWTNALEYLFKIFLPSNLLVSAITFFMDAMYKSLIGFLKIKINVFNDLLWHFFLLV